VRKLGKALILISCSVAMAAGQSKRSSPPQHDGPKLSTMIDRVRPSVVQIISYFGMTIEENKGTGTGFFVSPSGIVLTAKHVISSQPNTPCDTSPLKPPQPPPRVIPPGPKSVQASTIFIALPQMSVYAEHIANLTPFRTVPARVLACDDKHDIALLEPEPNPLTISDNTMPPYAKVLDKPIFTHSEKRGPAVLSASAFRDGDPIFTSGYPLKNATLITTSGYIASSAPVGVDEQTGKFEDVYWADIHVNPGNSGGPAFSLETGAVLGMVRAYQNAPVIFDDDHSKAFLPAQRPGQQAIQQVVPRYLDSNSGIAEIIPVEFIERLLRDNNVKFSTR
jgi:S1-C subfamily serine protease